MINVVPAVSIATPEVPPPAAIGTAELHALQAQLAAVQAAVARQQEGIAAANAAPRHEAATDDEILARLMERQKKTEEERMAQQATMQRQLQEQRQQQATAVSAAVAERDARIRALEETRRMPP